MIRETEITRGDKYISLPIYFSSIYRYISHSIHAHIDIDVNANIGIGIDAYTYRYRYKSEGFSYRDLALGNSGS